MFFPDEWMLYSILFPMTAAFVLQLLHHFAPARTRRWILLSCAVTAAITFGAAVSACFGARVLRVGGWSAELGILLVTDPLSAVFLFISAFGGAAAVWTTFGPGSAGGKDGWRLCGLFFILWSSLNGILTTGDLFNLFVFFEILAVSAYVLTGASMTREALEAGLKYLVLGTVGALLILLGMTMLYMGAGILNFALLSAAVGSIPRGGLAAASAFMVAGLGLKMGMVPFHFWLPDAHSSASTGVSMLLSGVVVKASFYALLRVTTLLFPSVQVGFSVQEILLALGILSLFTGHLSAQRQTGIKRMLAWSTVAHMGYLLVGIGLGSPMGVAGALLHSLNHAAAKTALFLGAGSFSTLAGSKEWRSFSGLGRRFPLQGAAFLLLAASIIGLPPLGGFWGKWMIVLAAMEEGRWMTAVSIELGTVLSCIYYVPVLLEMYTPLRGAGALGGGSFHSGRIFVALATTPLLFALFYFVPAMKDFLLAAGEWVLTPASYIKAVLGSMIP